MEKKLRVELSAEIDITFSDPDKVKAVFIDGDWKDAFWEFNDLDELVEHLAFAFHSEPEKWNHDKEKETSYFYRAPEGFGSFIKHDGNYVMEHETTGKIIIKYEEELNAGSAFEVPILKTIES